MKFQKGTTLIELLIASSMAVIVLGALGVQLSSQMNSSQYTMKQNKVNNSLQSLLDLMAQDLKRAGYSANTGALTGFTSKTAFNIYTIKASPNGLSCITFAYDRNNNGNLDNNERFGFALNNNAVVSFNGTGIPDCADINNTDWQNISNTKSILVTNLNFSLVIPSTPSGTPTEMPQGSCPLSILINITAKNTDGNNSSNTYTSTKKLLVKIRNDTSNDWSGSTCTYIRP